MHLDVLLILVDGLEVKDRVPLVVCPGDYNANYLAVKQTKLGHFINYESTNGIKSNYYINFFCDEALFTRETFSIHNEIEKISSKYKIKLDSEFSTRLRVFWENPYFFWNMNIEEDESISTNIDFSGIDSFIKDINKYNYFKKYGLVIARGKEKAMHPRENFRTINIPKEKLNQSDINYEIRKNLNDCDMFAMIWS